MNEFIKKLAEDFNSYSELVALNFTQIEEGVCNEATLQWNRGNLYRIEQYLDDIAKENNVDLKWECKEHEFGFDDWTRTLIYRTVEVVL